MSMWSRKTDRGTELKLGKIITVVCILAVVLSVVVMATLPIYGVWSKGLSGEAQLQEAMWNRQIAIEEAEARLKSAKLDAQSEVERAYGVAEANKIIGTSLQNNTGYLHYLWIQGLHDDNSEVIYIPTEMNLPIMKEI